ncbi:MAG: ribokinase [Defluviitaleaceae bacterium]|nr:ribokinase [Defluviitaleaceae bacterium]
MPKSLVFGAFVVDLMARAPHLPRPGETVKGSIFKMGAGGKGFNQCVAAHKAGADVVMITKLGRDNMAEVAIKAMDEAGMDKSQLLYSDEAETGITLIPVDENTGQNQIVVVPGASATISTEEILGIEPLIKEAEYILLQLEVNQDANEHVMDLAMRHGTKVILNTAPYSPVTDDFLSKAYMVTPNEVEADSITGVAVYDLNSASRAAKYFKDKGVKHVIITMGDKGAFVSSDGKEEIVPPFSVNAVDTTGAGDAFNGGLLTALLEGKDIWESVLFGNALAAVSVQRVGATDSMPSRQEILDMLKR